MIYTDGILIFAGGARASQMQEAQDVADEMCSVAMRTWWRVGRGVRDLCEEEIGAHCVFRAKNA